MTAEDIESATVDGAVLLRRRPKLMTVFAVVGSLGPIMWETGVSSDVMKPIAAPIVGGLIQGYTVEHDLSPKTMDSIE